MSSRQLGAVSAKTLIEIIEYNISTNNISLEEAFKQAKEIFCLENFDQLQDQLEKRLKLINEFKAWQKQNATIQSYKLLDQSIINAFKVLGKEHLLKNTESKEFKDAYSLAKKLVYIQNLDKK